MVESTLTVQSSPSATSHPARSRSRISCHVPSPDQRRCRMYTVFQVPYSLGRSRQGEPVRVRHRIPLITRRWSAHRPPRGGSEGSRGFSRSHSSSDRSWRSCTCSDLCKMFRQASAPRRRSKRQALAPTWADSIGCTWLHESYRHPVSHRIARGRADSPPRPRQRTRPFAGLPPTRRGTGLRCPGGGSQALPVRSRRPSSGWRRTRRSR